MLPVIFHNLKGFESHIIMTYIDRNFAPSDIQVIPTTSVMYISFQIGNLRFVDSLQFLNASLDSLVQSLVKDEVDTFQIHKGISKTVILYSKRAITATNIWTVETNLMIQNFRRENSCIAIWRKKVSAMTNTRKLRRYGMNSTSKIYVSTMICI